MTLFSLAAALGGLALLAGADPLPTTPVTTDIGQTLSITYTPDTTGLWTSCTISLMSGSNLAMNTVADITTTQDCTKSPGQLSWTVPAVSPTSAIYFLQFTNNNNATAYEWSTRFAIASKTGQTTPPANANQPNGQAIPWGTGSLVGGASPSGAAVGAVSVGGSGTSSPGAAPSGMATSVVQPAAAAGTSATAGTTSTVYVSASSAPSAGSSSNSNGASSSSSTSTKSGSASALLVGNSATRWIASLSAALVAFSVVV